MTAAKITEDTKDNLTDAELKAARKNPPGDTEASGAAPGAKAGDEPDTGTYKTPRATLKAEKDARERVEEVREQQLEAYLRNFGNQPAEVTETVHANRPEKGDPDSITFAQVGNSLVITATAKELVFGREEALSFIRAANKIGNSL